MGSQAVERTASSASISPTKPPTSAQSNVRGCPPPGTGPCPYAWILVYVPYTIQACVAPFLQTEPLMATSSVLLGNSAICSEV